MTVTAIIEWGLFWAVTAGIIGFTLVSLYRNNRLLFKCLLGVFLAYVLLVGGLYAAGMFFKQKPVEQLISITAIRTEQPKKEPEKIPEKLDLPLGVVGGDRRVTKVPKGSRSAKPGQRAPGSSRPMTSGFGPDGDIATDPDAKGPIFGPSDNISRDDLNFGQGGTGGETWGDPSGEGTGPPPAGFSEGKVGGRVYFIRMKHGSGAWGANDNGTRRLLSFLNQYFPCQSETWAVAAGEIRAKYLSKDALPSFLYLYCDEKFSLDATEVAVLSEYLGKGGFLFLDSRPGQDTTERVRKELDKVLPGMRLAPLPAKHPINTALFKLAFPGTGQNYNEQKNYGITGKDGRLVVFYTPGNFSNIYENFKPTDHEYYLAQYQMGANVMVYAITRGNVSGIAKRAGASARVTRQVLESLGLIAPIGQPAGGGKTESVKIKPPGGGTTDPSGPPAGPDEIRLDP